MTGVSAPTINALIRTVLVMFMGNLAVPHHAAMLLSAATTPSRGPHHLRAIALSAGRWTPGPSKTSLTASRVCSAFLASPPTCAAWLPRLILRPPRQSDCLSIGSSGRSARSLPRRAGSISLVFTAGIGENDPATRAEVSAGCRWLGLELDEQRNAGSKGRISTDASTMSAWVIPTDEERMILRHTSSTLGSGGNVAAMDDVSATLNRPDVPLVPATLAIQPYWR